MTSISAKKKISKDDLRRIMNEQKRKLSQVTKKIESPLAKYNPKGELTCIVCDSMVSESVWIIHINSKQHRDNIAKLKKRKDPEYAANTPTSIPSLNLKQPVTEVPVIPPKKIKGILKNAPQHAPYSVENSCNGKKENEESEEREEENKNEEEMVIESPLEELGKKTPPPEDVLPEGFFDDPLLDAKARNVEYKDPIEEEWEKFQKEIKEETSVSAQIISEDQEVATVERQIDEIDEQMRNWSRVINLEKKKEEVGQVTSGLGDRGEDDELSSADEAEFEEYLDWRSKKSYK